MMGLFLYCDVVQCYCFVACTRAIFCLPHEKCLPRWWYSVSVSIAVCTAPAPNKCTFGVEINTFFGREAKSDEIKTHDARMEAAKCRPEDYLGFRSRIIGTHSVDCGDENGIEVRFTSDARNVQHWEPLLIQFAVTDCIGRKRALHNIANDLTFHLYMLWIFASPLRLCQNTNSSRMRSASLSMLLCARLCTFFFVVVDVIRWQRNSN